MDFPDDGGEFRQLLKRYAENLAVKYGGVGGNVSTDELYYYCVSNLKGWNHRSYQ